VLTRPEGPPWSASHLDQQHARVRKLLKLSSDFVLHSLRHTFGARLGEAGADAFTIMRLMGHSTVTVSQRCVHPSPEAIELGIRTPDRDEPAETPSQIPPQSRKAVS
jgi:integrase